MTRPDTAEYVTFAPEAFTEQGTLTPAMRDYLASQLTRSSHPPLVLDLTPRQQTILANALQQLWATLSNAGTTRNEGSDEVAAVLNAVHAAGCASWVGGPENRAAALAGEELA